MTVIRAIDDKSFYLDNENNYYRIYSFIENSVSYDFVENSIQLYHCGKAFGRFQAMPSDFHAEQLNETIIDFRNTSKRVKQLEEAVKNNVANRASMVEKEIEFALSYSAYADKTTKKIADGTVLIRVTHNYKGV